MQVEWYGQSAFRLQAAGGLAAGPSGEAGGRAGRSREGTTVFIDPFADMSGMAASRGMQWDYPAIEGVDADLLLVTHEHFDHNGVEAIGGSPTVLRSTAGRHESPVGEVVGVASEHDEKAGTERGPNTIFVFDLDGVRCCHFGDFGQSDLRPEQQEAIGKVDLLFIPVGAGPTIGADDAKAIAERLGARWIVPMHYRTPKIGFLETADDFLSQISDVERLDSPSFDTASLPADKGPLAVVPAAP